MNYIPKWKELENLSDEELIAKYDANANNTVVGTGFFQKELSRRATNKQNQEMVKISRSVKNMTIAILVLTVFNVVLVGVTLFAGK